MDLDIADTAFDQDDGQLTLESSLRSFFLLFVYFGVPVFYKENNQECLFYYCNKIYVQTPVALR